jgi:hypothetical protein
LAMTSRCTTGIITGCCLSPRRQRSSLHRTATQRSARSGNTVGNRAAEAHPVVRIWRTSTPSCTDRRELLLRQDRIFATGWIYGGEHVLQVACERPSAAASATWCVRADCRLRGGRSERSSKPTAPGVLRSHVLTIHAVLLHRDAPVVTQLFAVVVSVVPSFATANGCTWQTPTKVTTGAHTCRHGGLHYRKPREFCSIKGSHSPSPIVSIRGQLGAAKSVGVPQPVQDGRPSPARPKEPCHHLPWKTSGRDRERASADNTCREGEERYRASADNTRTYFAW